MPCSVAISSLIQTHSEKSTSKEVTPPISTASTATIQKRLQPAFPTFHFSSLWNRVSNHPWNVASRRPSNTVLICAKLKSAYFLTNCLLSWVSSGSMNGTTLHQLSTQHLAVPIEPSLFSPNPTSYSILSMLSVSQISQSCPLPASLPTVSLSLAETSPGFVETMTSVPSPLPPASFLFHPFSIQPPKWFFLITNGSPCFQNKI